MEPVQYAHSSRFGQYPQPTQLRSNSHRRTCWNQSNDSARDFRFDLGQAISIKQRNDELYLIELDTENPPRLWKLITDGQFAANTDWTEIKFAVNCQPLGDLRQPERYIK